MLHRTSIFITPKVSTSHSRQLFHQIRQEPRIILVQHQRLSITNESGAELWKEHQNAFDRVRAVAVRVSEPKPADWIAEQAHVAGNTARDHLQLLVEMNVLRTATGGNATRYEPDPLYTRMQALRDFLNTLLLHTLLFVNTDRISVNLNMSDITN